MTDVEAHSAVPGSASMGVASRTARRLARTPGIPSLIVIGGFVGLWELLSFLDPRWFPEIILSRPFEIVPSFFEAIFTAFVWQNLWVTAQEVIIGFTVGSAVGFFLGTLVALSDFFRRGTYPVIVFIQSVPRVALAPIFIAWFGFGMTSKVALAIALTFFPVLVNTVTGLTGTGEEALRLMRSFQASRFQEFFHLRLPNAMPIIFAGLKTAATLAVIGAVVGELTSANQGVARLLNAASFQLRMDDVFAYLALLAIIGLALFHAVGLIERKVTFWQFE